MSVSTAGVWVAIKDNLHTSPRQSTSSTILQAVKKHAYGARATHQYRRRSGDRDRHRAPGNSVVGAKEGGSEERGVMIGGRIRSGYAGREGTTMRTADLVESMCLLSSGGSCEERSAEMLLGGRVWQFLRRLPGEVPVDRALIEPRFCAHYSSHRRHTAGTAGDTCLSAVP